MPRDQTQPGSFSLEREEPGNKVGEERLRSDASSSKRILFCAHLSSRTHASRALLKARLHEATATQDSRQQSIYGNLW